MFNAVIVVVILVILAALWFFDIIIKKEEKELNETIDRLLNAIQKVEQDSARNRELANKVLKK